MYRKATKKRLLLFAAPAWAVGLACLLSGCIALPGQEPFGEKTYPAEQAQAVYEKLSADMEQQEFMDQSGYIIQIRPFILSEDVSDFDYDVYKTEEYMVFAAEGSGEDYLWHKGRLYCSYYDNDHITYRDMAWEETWSAAFRICRTVAPSCSGGRVYEIVSIGHLSFGAAEKSQVADRLRPRRRTHPTDRSSTRPPCRTWPPAADTRKAAPPRWRGGRTAHIHRPAGRPPAPGAGRTEGTTGLKRPELLHGKTSFLCYCTLTPLCLQGFWL